MAWSFPVIYYSVFEYPVDLNLFGVCLSRVFVIFFTVLRHDSYQVGGNGWNKILPKYVFLPPLIAIHFCQG